MVYGCCTARRYLRWKILKVVSYYVIVFIYQNSLVYGCCTARRYLRWKILKVVSYSYVIVFIYQNSLVYGCCTARRYLRWKSRTLLHLRRAYSNAQYSALQLWYPKTSTYSLQSGNRSFGNDKPESSAESDLKIFGCLTSDLFLLTSVNVTYVTLTFCTSAAVP